MYQCLLPSELIELNYYMYVLRSLTNLTNLWFKSINIPRVCAKLCLQTPTLFHCFLPGFLSGFHKGINIKSTVLSVWHNANSLPSAIQDTVTRLARVFRCKLKFSKTKSIRFFSKSQRRKIFLWNALVKKTVWFFPSQKLTFAMSSKRTPLGQESHS